MAMTEPIPDRAILRPPPDATLALVSEQRRAEHRRSLLAPRRPYGRAARMLFFLLDLSYGRPRTLSKLRVLHVAVRAPGDEIRHLPVLEELVARRGERHSFVRFRLLPHLLAFVYHDLSVLLCAVRPSWRHNLGADVHDYAEHEFALFVQEHPELETAPGADRLGAGFGRSESAADVLRRIASDQHVSKLRALERIRRPRPR